MKKVIPAIFLVFCGLHLGAQSVDVYSPAPFHEIVDRSFVKSWTPSAKATVANLDYFILLDAETQSKALSIDATDARKVTLVDVASLHESAATYSSLLNGIFQWVDKNTSNEEALSGQYQMRPLMHTYYALTSTDGASVSAEDFNTYYVEEVSSSYLLSK